MIRDAGRRQAEGLSTQPTHHNVLREADALCCSFFNAAWDNLPDLRQYSWDDLRLVLTSTYYPGRPGEKKSMPAFSGAYYPPNVTRGKDTALGVSLFIQDYDNSLEEVIPDEFHLDRRSGKSTGRPKTRKIPVQDPVIMTEVMGQLQQKGIAAVAWTTWSHSPSWPKFRVVSPLAQPVSIDSWPQASEWALHWLGLDPFRRGLDIPVLHNPTALAFLSGSPDPSSITWVESSGTALWIPHQDLPTEPVASFPPGRSTMRDKSQGDETRWWTKYRVNGRPVDFQRLDLPSLLTSKGIKVGRPRAYKGGTKWRACCPWADEHTGGLDDDSAVIFQATGSWPIFHCSHSGHAHMGLRDLLEWAWGRP
jgi:hypothetical protein